MGYFSWLDCRTGKAIKVDKKAVILVPKEFGDNITGIYDGYGCVDNIDIYNLVTDWNREFLSNNPDYIVPSKEKKISDYCWYKYYADLSLSPRDIVEKVKALDESEALFDYRFIGIDIACYDKDNEKLPYPVKLAHTNAVYEKCKYSKDDPNQGL